MPHRPRAPAWVDNAVFYEIYPQTFCDSNGDGIGDIPGIIGKLDYVAGLGVNAVWLNPCYVSPMRDAGYDVADYCRVDPRYGTNADIKRLFREAKARGIRVILDLVPGHTSIDHPWFKDSSCEKPGKYRNWYIWTNSTWDFGGDAFRGKMIHGYCDRDGNFMTNFFWSQPALNFGFAKPDAPWQLGVNHPDVRALRAEFHRIIRFWLDMGASGFRVDMAGSLIRNDPGAREMISFWREIRAMIDRDYPDAFLVSEWSSPVHALRAGFHADFLHWFREYAHLFRNEGWKSNDPTGNHSFFHRNGKGDVTEFLRVYEGLRSKTARHGHICIPVGNHDLPRINMGRSVDDLELIHAFLLTIPGVPFLYYGDEIGMRQLEGDLPVKEGCYPPRNGARTPMQWTSGRNAGFSSASAEKLYLPVDTARGAPCVAAQEGEPRSLLNRMRALVQMRREEPALAAHAAFKVLYAKPRACPLVYLRSSGRHRILVALNPCERPVEARVALVARRIEPVRTNGARAESSRTGAGIRIALDGRGYGVFRI
jgi:glycosidase